MSSRGPGHEGVEVFRHLRIRSVMGLSSQSKILDPTCLSRSCFWSFEVRQWARHLNIADAMRHDHPSEVTRIFADACASLPERSTRFIH